MADSASAGDASGTSDGATPTAPAMTPNEPSRSYEGDGDNDDQAGEALGSDTISGTDQPATAKTFSPYDALLASEKAPDPANQFRSFLSKEGLEVKDWLDSMITQFISSNEIYDMWVEKLRKYAETYDKSPPGERAPRLARSFVDYVRTVDERLQKIEVKLDIDSKLTKQPEDVAGKEHTVQTKFYNASAQPQPKGMGVDDDETGWSEQGTFLSEVDRKHCLRVLFNWVQEHTIEADPQRNDEHPDPELIEISDIRIHSDPIAAFLSKQLDYEIHKDSVVHLKRPFRILIRKADSIKKQLAFLEREYRYSHKGH